MQKNDWTVTLLRWSRLTRHGDTQDPPVRSVKHWTATTAHRRVHDHFRDDDAGPMMTATVREKKQTRSCAPVRATVLSACLCAHSPSCVVLSAKHARASYERACMCVRRTIADSLKINSTPLTFIDTRSRV